MARNELLSTTEVAALLGVVRQRVHQMRDEYADFPEPVIERDRVHLYELSAVKRWARKHGYPKPKPKGKMR